MQAIVDSRVEYETEQDVADVPVEVVSQVITADEFLGLFEGGTEEFPLGNGKHAIIRTLSYAEVKRIVAQNRKRDEMELDALVTGTVQPKLTKDHVNLLRRSEKAGLLFKMAKRIMVISGMMDDDASMGEGGASS